MDTSKGCGKGLGITGGEVGIVGTLVDAGEALEVPDGDEVVVDDDDTATGTNEMVLALLCRGRGRGGRA